MDTLNKTMAGTRKYLAPEQKAILPYWENNMPVPQGMGYGCKVDVYAVGLILLELCGIELVITSQYKLDLTLMQQKLT